MNIDTPAGMAAAIVWTQNLINALRDGGVWAVPRTDTVYAFDKTNKIAVRNAPGDSSVDRVLTEMGWEVTTHVN